MIILKNDFKTIQIALYLTDLDDRKTAAIRYLLPRLLIATSNTYSTRKLMNEKMEHLYGAYFSTRTERMGNLSIMLIGLTIVDPKIVKDPKLFTDTIALFKEVLSPERVFSRDVFSDEKRMLMETWATLKDRKRAYAKHKFNELFFGQDAYGYPLSGTLSDIKRLTLDKIEQYYQNIFHQQKKQWVINGHVEDETIKLFEEAFGQSEASHVPFVTSFDGPTTLRVEHEITDMKQAIIHLGYTYPIYRQDKLYDAAVLAETIIGGYPESRLFKKIREEKGLCYDVGSSYDYYKGVMMIVSGVDLGQLDYAISSMRELIENSKIQGVTEQELLDAKSYYIHQLKSSLDQQSILTKRAFVRDLLGFKETIEEKIAAIEKVQLDEVKEALKTLTLTSVYVLKGESK